MKRRKVKNTRFVRQYVKQWWRCHYCNVKMKLEPCDDFMTTDHIEPFRKVWNKRLNSNFVLSCNKCNYLKWDIDYDLFIDWYLCVNYKPWYDEDSFTKAEKLREPIKWYQKLFPSIFSWNDWFNNKTIKLYD